MGTPRTRVDRAVLDQQKLPGGQAANEEPRRGVLDSGRGHIAPGLAAVRRDAFADAVAGAHEHPEAAVLPFHDDVLIGVALLDLGNVGRSEVLPRRPLVR